MRRLEWVHGAWKMNYASRENDIVHEAGFSRALMLNNKRGPDQIDIQTFPDQVMINRKHSNYV